VLFELTRVRLGKKPGEISKTESHRDDTGKQLGRFGQKAPGVAAARDGQQCINSKGTRQGRKIAYSSGRATHILVGGGVYIDWKGLKVYFSLP
jgi:hypothetical protein